MNSDTTSMLDPISMGQNCFFNRNCFFLSHNNKVTKKPMPNHANKLTSDHRGYCAPGTYICIHFVCFKGELQKKLWRNKIDVK